MIKLHNRMLLTWRGSIPQPPDHQTRIQLSQRGPPVKPGLGKFGTLANNADLDEMPQNVTSGQGTGVKSEMKVLSPHSGSFSHPTLSDNIPTSALILNYYVILESSTQGHQECILEYYKLYTTEK